MLVLSRKEDQAILIGEHIKIQIIRVHGNRVRLGIEAPSKIHVLRGELAEWHEVPSGDANSQPEPTG